MKYFVLRNGKHMLCLVDYVVLSPCEGLALYRLGGVSLVQGFVL